MKSYYVKLIVERIVNARIEAESEKDAIKKAWEWELADENTELENIKKVELDKRFDDL